MEKGSICYIDDNHSNLLLVKKSLADNYHVVGIDSPESAIDILISSPPELILLDVNMPKIDGYQLCQNIKTVDNLKEIPVVFLTCRESLEDRLEGFESGGEAYICKPFDIAELEQVITSLIKRRKEVIESVKKAEDASSLAFTLMKNSSEMGSVVGYARQLAETRDMTSLIKKTFLTLSEFGLSSTLLVDSINGRVVTRSDGATVLPIEIELLDLAKGGGRIVNASRKYLFQGKNTILLIKNMPLEDDALTGRLRDHLAIMIDLLDPCLELINYRERERLERQKTTDTTHALVNKEFDNIISLCNEFMGSSKQAFEHLTTNIEESFMFLGLSEEQEAKLTQFVEEAREEVEQFKDIGLKLSKTMNKISEQVDSM